MINASRTQTDLECSWKGEEEGDTPFPVLHEENMEEDPTVLRSTEINGQVGSVELLEVGRKDTQLSLHGEGVFCEGAIVERNTVSGKTCIWLILKLQSSRSCENTWWLPGPNQVFSHYCALRQKQKRISLLCPAWSWCRWSRECWFRERQLEIMNMTQ